MLTKGETIYIPSRVDGSVRAYTFEKGDAYRTLLFSPEGDPVWVGTRGLFDALADGKASRFASTFNQE